MLILERKEGESVYGGFNLRSDDPAGTFDHQFIVREIVAGRWPAAEIAIVHKDGEVEEVFFKKGADTLALTPSISIVFVGSREFEVGAGSFERLVRIGFKAPAHYSVLRDNAICTRRAA